MLRIRNYWTSVALATWLLAFVVTPHTAIAKGPAIEKPHSKVRVSVAASIFFATSWISCHAASVHFDRQAAAYAKHAGLSHSGIDIHATNEQITAAIRDHRATLTNKADNAAYKTRIWSQYAETSQMLTLGTALFAASGFVRRRTGPHPSTIPKTTATSRSDRHYTGGQVLKLHHHRRPQPHNEKQYRRQR